MKNAFAVFLLLISVSVYAQKQDASKNDAWKTIYRSTPERINDLVNTKLEVSFDFQHAWMPGKAWITLHPHFYPTDSLDLDAHSFTLNEISVIQNGKHIPLKYSYDSLNIRIKLDRTYSAAENYVIYIDYVAKPNDIKIKGSAAINDAKGLYFINPLGKDKNKPVQVWTQGETESNSGWFPTIDKPNQKTTDEISITVPSRFVTLSNGLMTKQKKNSDGTRTDTWKMDLPHAPYLMMMAVGEYSVTKDTYKGKEVSYYVEKEYEPVARKIFGLTPEMIKFYSGMTGVDYPWQKYSQVAVRNYVSGAMENTTATVHGETVQQDARELLDGNGWEETIAHELFHMWFGDLVTTESWSNLTINESWATYGALAWAEYKHGPDGFGEEFLGNMQTYLYSGGANKDLVRFFYRTPEDVFDGVSYQKGSCILYMLRNYVGDSAFEASIKLFLTRNKYRAVEAQELRLAFEEVTGKDLNWFFNQWFYGSGHPKLDVSYDYDQAAKTAKVYVKQTQKDKVFKLPVAIDVYQGGNKVRYKVWADSQADTFSFPCPAKPDLVNFDGDRMLLCEKTDRKTLDNFIYQYKYAGLYLDRRDAIDFAAGKQKNDPAAQKFLLSTLNDKYYGLRSYAISKLNTVSDSLRTVAEPLLLQIAKNDPNRRVRASAIDALGRSKKKEYRDLYIAAIADSSYSVAGSGLQALAVIDSAAGIEKAKVLAGQKTKGRLNNSVNTVLFNYAGEKDFADLTAKFESASLNNGKFQLLQSYANYLKKVKDDTNFRKGIDIIIGFRDSTAAQYGQQILSYINGMILTGIANSKQTAGLNEQAEYVKNKIKSAGEQEKAVVTVAPEVLQKYTGEYTVNDQGSVKVILKDNKTLFINFSAQQEVEMIPQSKTAFTLKFMQDYKVDFAVNDKGEVTGMIINAGGQEVKADKKK
jgi:aminopeptidase N